jgi:hypothetical protein
MLDIEKYRAAVGDEQIDNLIEKARLIVLHMIFTFLN